MNILLMSKKCIFIVIINGARPGNEEQCQICDWIILPGQTTRHRMWLMMMMMDKGTDAPTLFLCRLGVLVTQ